MAVQDVLLAWVVHWSTQQNAAPQFTPHVHCTLAASVVLGETEQMTPAVPHVVPHGAQDGTPQSIPDGKTWYRTSVIARSGV
jgi:hypothetical protein